MLSVVAVSHLRMEYQEISNKGHLSTKFGLSESAAPGGPLFTSSAGQSLAAVPLRAGVSAAPPDSDGHPWKF